MQHPEQTDSDIAHSLKMGKSSISQMRTRLEKAGVITGRTHNLDYDKLGVSFYALFTFQWNSPHDEKLTRKMEEDFTSTPPLIYFAQGSTPNSRYVAMMAFLDFENYNDFLEEFKKKYGAHISGLETTFIQQKRVMKQTNSDLAKMLLGGV